VVAVEGGWSMLVVGDGGTAALRCDVLAISGHDETRRRAR